MTITHQTIGGIDSIAWARCGARDEETKDKFSGWSSLVTCQQCLGDETTWPEFLAALKKA
jgi:hypothetical protein